MKRKISKLLGVILLSTAIGLSTTSIAPSLMEETPVEEPLVVNPTITLGDVDNGSIALLVIRGVPLEDFDKETDLVIDDIKVKDENYLENDVAVFTFTPEKYFIVDTESISIGVEQEIVTKTANDLTMYAFTLKNNTNYVISADFDVDIEGIIAIGKDKIENSAFAEWWNQYVYPVIGLTITAFISLIITFIFTYVQKSDWKLGVRNYGNYTKQVEDNTNNALVKMKESLSLFTQAVSTFLKYIVKLPELIEKINVLFEIEVEKATHDQTLVKNGTAKSISEKVLALNEKYKENTEETALEVDTTETKGETINEESK